MSYNIKDIKKTKRIKPPKIVIVGPSKIGKTTFASSDERAIGILTEDGSHNVDANAFPLCTKLTEVYSCIESLINEEHEYSTLYIDSLDWLEPLLWAHVSEVKGWSSIEQPGYGKGYTEAIIEWKNLLAGLDVLSNTKNMTIILVAHEKVKHFESPLHEGYDRFTIKLHDKATALLEEWADIIGHANYKVLTKSSDAGFGQKETKAITTGERMLYVEPHPAHCGGNRFGLKNMSLDWDAFKTELKQKQG